MGGAASSTTRVATGYSVPDRSILSDAYQEVAPKTLLSYRTGLPGRCTRSRPRSCNLQSVSDEFTLENWEPTDIPGSKYAYARLLYEWGIAGSQLVANKHVSLTINGAKPPPRIRPYEQFLTW